MGVIDGIGIECYRYAMKTIRIGIIGLGQVGQKHAEYLLSGHITHATLAAVCTRTKDNLLPYHEKGIATFTSKQELLSSGTVDAVLIATPAS